MLAEEDYLIASDTQPINWKDTELALAALGQRLGKAGFLTTSEHSNAKLTMIGIISCGLCIGIVLGYYHSLMGCLIGGIAGTYISLLIWLSYLRYRTSDFVRQVTFQIPILLESIILLVESGFGILPSIERAASVSSKQSHAVKRLFYIVYQLSAHGLPFTQALESVADAVDIKILRHVLMHLDISNSDGGELIPSLRSLSDHAHSEWKHSVEKRVKKLENLVVFPVFASVLGLMLLIASVPLVPLLNLKDSFKNKSQISQSSQVSLQTDYASTSLPHGKQ